MQHKTVIKFERYIFALVLTFLMVAIAEFSGEREIIFPEIVALSVGAWISNKQPWMSNKRKMFALVSAASLFGVLVVRYLPAPLIVQVCVCFAFTGLALTFTRTTLIPIISACILPVYLQTATWVYPISVTIMATIIITMQWIMEKIRLRPVNHYVPCEFNLKEEFIHWSKLLALLALISVVPIYSRNVYFVAPPLIVAFTEFSNVKSPLRKKPFRVILLLTITACIGAYMRVILNQYLHLPLFVCAILACAVLFLTFERIHTLFPPAGAILLLPMILNSDELMLFPLEVLVGSSVLIPLAMLIFKDKKSVQTADEAAGLPL